MSNNIFEKFKEKLGKETPFDFHGPYALLFTAVPWTYPGDKNEIYILGANRGRDAHIIISDDRYKNFAKEKFSKFMFGKITVDSQNKIHEDISINANKLYQKFSVSQNLNHLDFSELKKELKVSRDVLSNLIADTIYIETFDKDIILSNVDDKTANTISALWEDMMRPAIISFENRRNKFIVDNFEKKGLKETAILARYIYTDYFTAQSLSFVEDQIKNTIGRKKEIEEKINSQKITIKKNAEYLSAKVKNESQKVKDIVEYTQFVINQRDLRKDPIAKIQTVMYDIAAGIITNEGGITSHAAIVSRELGIPCIIGTKIATKVLKDGDLVEVDADNGVVRILERAGK